MNHLVWLWGWIRKVLLWITIFMLLLVNNVVQKGRTRVTNTISLYKLFFLLFICFKFLTFQKYFIKNENKLSTWQCFIDFITNLKQISDKRALINLSKDILLVSCVRIFCTTLITNNNIKIVIKSSTFLIHRLWDLTKISFQLYANFFLANPSFIWKLMITL